MKNGLAAPAPRGPKPRNKAIGTTAAAAAAFWRGLTPAFTVGTAVRERGPAGGKLPGARNDRNGGR
jgi:hypothetical protein